MNNRGFSLVELLSAIAIAAIVITAIGRAMVVGVKQYSTANTESSLQERAQIIMNILQDEIMDSTDGPVIAEDPSYKPNNIINIYHGENGQEKSEVFLTNYDAEKNEYELMYKKNDASERLASGVKSFRCGTNAEKSSIILELELSEGDRSFSVSKSVFMRNHMSFRHPVRVPVSSETEENE